MQTSPSPARSIRHVPSYLCSALTRLTKLTLGQEPEPGLVSSIFSPFMQFAVERMLHHEIERFLSVSEPDPVTGQQNSRNGFTSKVLHTDLGRVTIRQPRDRMAKFTSVFLPRYARQYPGRDGDTLRLMAKGTLYKDIERYIRLEFGPGTDKRLIQTVAMDFFAYAANWQAQNLDAHYDRIVVGPIQASSYHAKTPKLLHVVMGKRSDGEAQLLGIYRPNESPLTEAYWAHMLEDMMARGLVQADEYVGFDEVNAKAALQDALIRRS